MARKKSATIAEPEPAAPPVVKLREMNCCPVCGRPGQWLGKITTKCCHLFQSLGMLKFDADKNHSARIANGLLRKYHAVICEGCKLPVEQCRAKKIANAIKLARKLHGLKGAYADEYIRGYLADHACT